MNVDDDEADERQEDGSGEGQDERRSHERQEGYGFYEPHEEARPGTHTEYIANVWPHGPRHHRKQGRPQALEACEVVDPSDVVVYLVLCVYWCWVVWVVC